MKVERIMQWRMFNVSPVRLKSDILAVFKNISENKVFVTEIQPKSRSHSEFTVNFFELINITRMKPLGVWQSSRPAILGTLMIFECTNHRSYAKKCLDVYKYVMVMAYRLLTEIPPPHVLRN
jgi:hypothetical protein